jgi:hypothetical protein
MSQEGRITECVAARADAMRLRQVAEDAREAGARERNKAQGLAAEASDLARHGAQAERAGVVLEQGIEAIRVR